MALVSSTESSSSLPMIKTERKDRAECTCKIAWGMICEYPESPEFFSADKEYAFSVKYFGGSNSTVTFQLKIVKAPEDKAIHLRYHVSLWDLKQKNLTRDFDWNHKNYKTGQNLTQEHNYLSYDQCKDFLSDGYVRFFCEVEILEPAPPVLDTKIDVSDEFGSLFKSGKFSDMVLSVEGKDFAVHKAFLAARSPVFAAMFENKDSREMQEGRISIEDMSSDVAEVMLKHIYTGSIPSNKSEYAFDLYVAADKYQLIKLKSVCEKDLANFLGIGTVCSVLLIADGSNSKELKLKCIDFFCANSVEVMETEAWKQIMNKHGLVLELLQSLSSKSQPYFSNGNKKLKTK